MSHLIYYPSSTWFGPVEHLKSIVYPLLSDEIVVTDPAKLFEVVKNIRPDTITIISVIATVTGVANYLAGQRDIRENKKCIIQHINSLRNRLDVSVENHHTNHPLVYDYKTRSICKYNRDNCPHYPLP